jgi:hypothetical protein
MSFSEASSFSNPISMALSTLGRLSLKSTSWTLNPPSMLWSAPLISSMARCCLSIQAMRAGGNSWGVFPNLLTSP